ncbi:MAG TPA: UvrD-helicase domain-containing protein [Solirubrobacteraceae bacterium]|nr:UvrD-helicase domain-containing protein [Solirubrobacteraceae bacterium]
MSVALSPEQLAAVQRRSGPLAVSANAGSGKTSVLVERYVRAVIEDGIAPSRILAITFTDRAAGELRERVRARLAAVGEREAARESLAAFVSTIHGFCARLLRTHAVLAGRSPDFAVLGEAQAAAMRDGAFDSALQRWLDDPAALELAAAFGVEELRGAVSSVYDELRSRGERTPALPAAVARHDPPTAAAALARAAATVSAELAGAPSGRTVERALERLEAATELLAGGEAERVPLRVDEVALGNGAGALSTPACAAYEQARLAYRDACADRLGAEAVAALDALLGAFAARYAAVKRRRGVVDFDDLELEAGALLREHDEVRALWSARFDLLMVDELQDTNPRQMELLAALDRDNLFTVGDEFQSIYGFRHADVGLFRDRRETLAASGAASVLSANFRSRAPLLAAVNAVFGPRFGERFVALVPGRADAPAPAPVIELLIADSEGWEPHEERLGVELAPSPLWRRAEARALARRIEELIGAGEASAEDIVILFRAAGAIWVYEAALADLGLTTLATAGGGFFARPEVVDLVAYLRALANPLDELALYGVLASPLCGCGADALVALALGAREAGTSLWERLAAEPPDARGAAFAERFAAARRDAADRGLGEIVAAAVAENGYDLQLAALHSPERRIANVRKLERLARDFEQREGRDLRRFVAALALGRVGSLRETEAPPPAAGTGAIRLMTIHAAKGLEFPVVVVADLGHATRDRPPALLSDGRRVGLRLPTLERRPLETLAFAQLRAERSEAARAEEERVTYVAMTRACERLILSGAARFEPWPQEGAAALSWLGPALVPDLAGRAAAAAAPGRSPPPAVAEVWAAGDVALRLTLCTPTSAAELLWPPRQAGVSEGADSPLADSDPMPNAPPSARVSAPNPSSLSYTAIAEYERCAYRYQLQRIAGLPDVAGAGGGEGAAARGVLVHALLERCDFAAPREPGPAEVAAAAALAGVVLEPGEEVAAIAALAGAFARSPLCTRLANAHEVSREQPFAFLLGGDVLVRGFLDAAALEQDGTLLVVDYKSDRIAEGGDPRAQLERDYSIQRLVYALAGLASGAAAVEVAHCFLRRPELVLSARYQAGERPRLEAELTERLAPLRAGRFEVSGDPQRDRCGTCPGRARLCSYEESMTLRAPSIG